jgi:preprotein translocase subunit SecD
VELGLDLVQGFALVFGIGVLVSMLTAITVSRVLLLSVGIDRRDTLSRMLFGSGFSM